MSGGSLRSEDAAVDEAARFADVLADDEEVRLSWGATGVRWANERWTDLQSTTAFAATDRRVVFETGETATSVGYDRIRAVKTDAASDARGASTALVGCGGVCLLVGLVVATRDLTNGVGLVLVSAALLAVGSATAGSSEGATVTIVIGNERQRLSFSADESIGAELAEFVAEN